MRILRIYPTLPPYAGGLEQHVVRLSEAQRRLNMHVTIAYNYGAASAHSDVQVGGHAAIHRLRPQALRDVVFYCWAAIRLARMRVRADVVHLHGDWSAFICGRLLARVVGAKVLVASVHDRLREGRIWDCVYGLVLREFHLCYSTGQHDARRLAQVARRETSWITSGLHPIFQHTAEVTSAPVRVAKVDVITVATLTAKKRVDFVLEIAKLMPFVRFMIVGDGPERGRLEDLLRKHSVDNVEFCGRLNVDEVHAAYHSSRIFLLTSASEGTPTAILEAMACGLPIVTSASNDFSQLLEDEVTGYVVDSPDPRHYAERIIALLSDKRLLEEIGETNRLRARRFAWPAIAQRITSAMEAAVRS